MSSDQSREDFPDFLPPEDAPGLGPWQGDPLASPGEPPSHVPSQYPPTLSPHPMSEPIPDLPQESVPGSWSHSSEWSDEGPTMPDGGPTGRTYSEAPYVSGFRSPTPAQPRQRSGFLHSLATSPYPVTTGIILACVAWFIVTTLFPSMYYASVLSIPMGLLDHPWTIITSMFTHVSLTHIAFNMLMLWVAGRYIEPVVGSKNFAAIYLISGIAGALASIIILSARGAAVAGASGAIFGLIGATLILNSLTTPGARQQALRTIGALVAMQIVLAFLVVGVAWMAHLGGMVGGVLATWILKSSGPQGTPLTRRFPLGLYAMSLIGMVVATVAWMLFVVG